LRQQSPANSLTELERQRVMATADAPEYAHLPPCKIVPLLADKGLYIASESTFYRILRAVN
jgi:putative transposase